MAKRFFDVVMAMVALLVFSLPILIIAILLKFREKHAVFFRQERVGQDKERFEILKFQTLVNDIPTRTGAVLRRTGLDELPQFFNVLKGDMSIVGPRALTAADIRRLGWEDAYHARRWEVKPGITGFAQIYGGQHKKTSWFWDIYYLGHNNPLIDLGIIAISFLMNILGKTRVRRFVFQKHNLL